MEWIKCSDRLPEDAKSWDTFIVAYAWTDAILNQGETKIQSDVAVFNAYHKLFCNSNGEPIDDNETKVIAWMPLPEPPKE